MDCVCALYTIQVNSAMGGSSRRWSVGLGIHKGQSLRLDGRDRPLSVLAHFGCPRLAAGPFVGIAFWDHSPGPPTSIRGAHPLRRDRQPVMWGLDRGITGRPDTIP